MTIGATLPAGFTVTVTSSDPVSAPSYTLRRSTYVPAALKLTLVVSAVGAVNVAVPGPLTCDHVSVGVGSTCPSSVTVAVSVAVAGNVIT